MSGEPHLVPGRLLDECPECGHWRVVRKNSKTTELFIGCTGYPNCKKTWPIDDYHEAGDFSWRQG